MKNLFKILLAIIAPTLINVSGQDIGECFTPPLPPEGFEIFIDKNLASLDCLNTSITNPSDTLYNYSFIPSPTTSTKYIKVNIQVIQDGSGNNNFDQNNPQHLNYLNNIFNESLSSSVNGMYENLDEPIYEGNPGIYYISDSKIQFSLEGIYFHQDDSIYHPNINGNRTSIRNHCLQFGRKMDTEINIFLLPDGVHPSPGTTSVGGWGPASISGMPHPFTGAVFMANVFYDYYHQGARHWIVNPIISHELGHVFGLWHTFSDDYPDVLCSQSEYNRFSPQLYCPEDDSWCSPSTDTHCSNNMMGYNKDKAWLAPLQIGHIHRVFSSNPARIRYLKSCDYNSANDIVISNNTLWDKATVVGGNITIMPGNTLEVTCMLSLPNNGRIVIKPGAKLIVDGGIITNSCGGTWQGLFVEGRSDLPQSPSQVNKWQGALILKNGAIIENAIDAVRLRNVTSGTIGNGGVVQATNATFRNNKRDIEFNPYIGQILPGVDDNNISYFTNCSFETDANSPHSQYLSHVRLHGVIGVKFTNCTFSDERDNIDYITHQKAREDSLYSLSFQLPPSSFELPPSSFLNLNNPTIQQCNNETMKQL